MNHVMIPLACHALARQFLMQQRGYEILKDNFSRGMDSIDFIAFDAEQSAIVFVELRLRHLGFDTDPNPYRDLDKRRFERLSLAFLSKYPCLFTYKIRADQLNLTLLDEQATINYYINVASIDFE